MCLQIPHPDTTQQPQPRKQIPTAVSNAYQQEGKNVTYTGNPEVAVRDTKNLLVFATLLKLREMSKDISGWKEITRDEINALYKANGLERYDLKSLQGEKLKLIFVV